MKFLFLLDYDGTLTPIVKRPDLAILSPQRRKVLHRLAKHPSIRVAIVSGRKLSDVKKLIGIPGIIYVGNHGFEIEVNKKRHMHPAAEGFVPTLKKIKYELIRAAKVNGIMVEDKGLTLSFHYRLVSGKDLKAVQRIFWNTLRPFRKEVRITKGKKVFEICPPVDWDKGKAVKWIIRKLRLKDYLPIYIGDDQTDEDAFRALKEKGLTMKVGMGGKTIADGRLKNVSEVYRFLSQFTVKG